MMNWFRQDSLYEASIEFVTDFIIQKAPDYIKVLDEFDYFSKASGKKYGLDDLYIDVLSNYFADSQGSVFVNRKNGTCGLSIMIDNETNGQKYLERNWI